MVSDDLTRFFGSLNGRLEEARQSERQALQQFFFDLSPRLETARSLDAELDRQLARRFNFFRYLRTDELGLSKMIADLLDPLGDHGQGETFLRCLMERLEFTDGCKLGDSKVFVEHSIAIADRRWRLDIVVQIDKERCLAIENKSNYAGDQKGQVQDYLWWLQENFSQSLLIYLSPTGEGPSEESVDSATIGALNKKGHRFAIMPCGSSVVPDDTFSLADWLADCRRNCDVDRLRSFLREAETYCQRQYGGNAVTDAERTAVRDFVLEGGRNVATAFAVYSAWPEVAGQIKSQFLELIRNKLDENMVGLWDLELPARCYGDKPYQSWVYIRKGSWRPYLVDGQERFTGLQMMAASKASNGYFIGVYSPPADSVSADERRRRQSLDHAFAPHGGRRDSWPWFEWVDEQYRDWDSLVPRLYQEIKEDGGEIVEYFVQRFKDIAEIAVPLIDEIDGS